MKKSSAKNFPTGKVFGSFQKKYALRFLSIVGRFSILITPSAYIFYAKYYYSSTADAVPLLSQEKANLTHSSVNSFIKNLLSE